MQINNWKFSMAKRNASKNTELVLQCLREHLGPCDLQELHEHIRYHNASMAFSTIFRIVRKLEQDKKVVRVDWRERGSKYELADLPHHHHLICTKCGKVVDIDDSHFFFNPTKLEQETGFIVEHHHVEIEGICSLCQ